jgi:K+-transporting ATPase ATPase A chain
MSTSTAGAIFVLTLLVAWAVTYRFLGDHLFRVLTSTRHGRVERTIYRLVGVNPGGEQTVGVYLRSVLAFSAVSILLLYGLQRLQSWLPLDLGLPGVQSHVAWNTAVSFVTNTNWQAYSGESTMSHLTQMAGLAVQNFVSSAVGIAVAAAFVRGLARHQSDRLGNFWVDLTRVVVRVLLPIAVLGALVFIAAGMVQNLSGGTEVTTLVGGSQTVPGGPVASQEIIKELGTNGGGFYNVNSSHPFENPTGWTNWLVIFLLGLIPISLPRAFGRMVGDKRQGLAIVAAMAVIAIASISALNIAELGQHGTVPEAVGASMEGRETRFGVATSATFAAATTLTSTGSVDSFHDSYSGLGGGVLLFNMMLGEVAPGGVGSGLYGMLVLAIITVFVAGLMVGRTPESWGRRSALVRSSWPRCTS